MCYIPLNMAIIVFLCLLGSLPPTATTMFAAFILHIICRHLKRTRKIKDERIKKIKQLPQPVQETIHQLQKVAFDALVDDKIVFTIDELPIMCRDDPTCFGLLQSVECYCADEIGGPTKSFNFLHLGVQEYFAAKYVATLPEGYVYTLLEYSFPVSINNKGYFDNEYFFDHDYYGKIVRLSNMWIFYCGITGGQCNSLKCFLALCSEDHLSSVRDESVTEYWYSGLEIPPALQLLFPEFRAFHYKHYSNVPEALSQSRILVQLDTISQTILKDPVMVLFLFQCFQEAQDNKLCEMLSKAFDNGEIKLCDIFLPPYQVASLGFFLSQSKRNWKVLNLSGCNIRDYGVSLLHHYLCGHRTNKQVIESVTLIKNNLTGTSSPLVSNIINHFQLQELTISADEISVIDINDAITNSVTIKTLNLYRKPSEHDGYGYIYAHHN